ncbi:MAG TPA: aminopeptidase [Ruminococcaceae bacterium]|nr:aminopeptidase [Oscillospiraceae bacterium]
MSKNEELRKELFYQPKHICDCVGEEEIKKADAFAEGYKSFMSENKTEREIVSFVSRLAEENGYAPFDSKAVYHAGDKVIYNNRGKAVILAVIGQKPVEEGVRIAVAHIDSPRLDLKPNPLYEDTDLALFKTHYYGGIKKYQWTAIPLSLHGVVMKKNGESLTVNIGEDAGDPKFVVTDLLPHLATDQMKRTLSEGVKGEELNVLVGSRPFAEDEGSERVKLNILSILNEKYGLIESDFLSAELEIVPAFGADDIGFDRGLIGAYGHDDRVCAYPSLMAVLDCGEPAYTAVTVLTDKEEIGSDGNTGLESEYLSYFLSDLARMQGCAGRDVMSKSECLSADVNAAFDPTFPSVMDKMNASYANRGIVVTKYTGARGKSGTSDASAEFMGRVRRLFDENGVVWQIGELGKVDEGGGGTVAKYMARHNIDVVDVGVPVLSMHAPYEVISKLDLYMAYRAFLTFFTK